MKLISTGLLAAGLASLAACGGGTANNAAGNGAGNVIEEPLPPVEPLGNEVNTTLTETPPPPVEVNTTTPAAGNNSVTQ